MNSPLEEACKQAAEKGDSLALEPYPWPLCPISPRGPLGWYVAPGVFILNCGGFVTVVRPCEGPTPFPTLDAARVYLAMNSLRIRCPGFEGFEVIDYAHRAGGAR